MLVLRSALRSVGTCSSSSPTALTTARDLESCSVKTSRGQEAGESIGDDDGGETPLKSDRPGEPCTPAVSTRWISAREQRSAVAIARNERPARRISVAAERQWRAGAVYSARLIRERSRAASRTLWRAFSRSRCATIRASRSSRRDVSAIALPDPARHALDDVTDLVGLERTARALSADVGRDLADAIGDRAVPGRLTCRSASRLPRRTSSAADDLRFRCYGRFRSASSFSATVR